jgi:hypothetical protein
VAWTASQRGVPAADHQRPAEEPQIHAGIGGATGLLATGVTTTRIGRTYRWERIVLGEGPPTLGQGKEINPWLSRGAVGYITGTAGSKPPDLASGEGASKGGALS